MQDSWGEEHVETADNHDSINLRSPPLLPPTAHLSHAPQVMALQQEVRQALLRHRNQYGEGTGTGDFLKLPHNPFANPVGPTFKEFAQYVADTKQDDEHWRSYSAHCAPCTLTYDFVLR